MLCKCYWIVLHDTVHVTAFSLGAVFSGHGLDPFLGSSIRSDLSNLNQYGLCACGRGLHYCSVDAL